MNIGRAFLVMGSLYIVVGVALGIHMGSSGDHSQAPTHAHINLLGFVSMMVFGFAYHLFPKMQDGVLSKVHFWIHQTMVPIILVNLFLLVNGTTSPENAEPIFMITEPIVWAGYVIFAYLIFKHAGRD
ncbi:MAG: hypothetical protein EP347_09000 [Alphaproteobacteria bacterium]|nr:MAG: hypothetical protein EP347_09000 [Alphaproteobacteria bacterium]